MQDLSSEQISEAQSMGEELSAGSSLALSKSEVKLFKAHMLSDSYDFTKFFCGHKDLNNSFHRPLSYLASHSSVQLGKLLRLDSYPSFVLEEIRMEMHRHGVWEDDPDFFRKLDLILDFVNMRLYRGSGKSSTITHGVNAFDLTRHPNNTTALMGGNDTAALEWTMQIRDTFSRALWQEFFPERLPPGSQKEMWTQNRLMMGGRTISHPQWPLEARGFLSQWTRTHFNRIVTDDIVGEHTLESELPEIERNLRGISGLYMPKRRIFRLHVGTVWFPRDDHFVLKQIPKMFNLVVPIEVFKDDAPDDLTVRGIPTNREWHEGDGRTAEEAISDLQGEVLANDNAGLGMASWARNMLLNPGVGDAMVFPPSLINKSKFRIKNEGERLFVGVPKFDSFGKPVYQGKELAMLWRDVRGDLSLFLGVDPAFSRNGDDWVVSVIGVDQIGNYFHLDKITGKGWHLLPPAMEKLSLLWRIQKIGFEKQTAQEAIDDAIRGNPKFRKLSHKIELIPPKGTKGERIRALVASNMACNRLWLHPSDDTTHKEMEYYIEGPKAKDNILDSIAYGIMVSSRKRAPMRSRAEEPRFARLKRERESRYNVKVYRHI